MAACSIPDASQYPDPTVGVRRKTVTILCDKDLLWKHRGSFLYDTLVHMEQHFGEHLTIDGYGGDPELLNNGELVRASFTELCQMLGMHPLIEPQAISAPDNGLKDPGGWSGFVIIAESHISIHTFPKRRFVSADVYTCRNGMHQGVVADFFRNKFKLEDIEKNFIKRGLMYPQSNVV
jgi:S-adenosylmethionine decarboxylase